MLLSIAGCSSQASKPADSGSTPAAAPAKQEAPKIKYPEKPITMIVSFAAGGGTDVGARMLAAAMEKTLGQSIVVVNKPGGGGWVGWAELAKAKNDGYTIGFINTPNFQVGWLDPKVKQPFGLGDFIPVANHVLDPGAIAVRKDSPYKTIEEVFAAAKANPGKLSTTSTGVNSDDHFAAMGIGKALGNQGLFNVVHTQGAADGLTNVLGGHIDLYFANVGEVKGPADAGDLRVLAIMNDKRMDWMPNVPTLKEKGVDWSFYSARGVAVPKGTDPQIVAKLEEAIKKAVEDPAHVEQMKKVGLPLQFMSSKDYLKFLGDEEVRIKAITGW